MSPSRLHDLLSAAASLPGPVYDYDLLNTPGLCMTAAELGELCTMGYLRIDPVSNCAAVTTQGHAQLLALQESARSASTQEFASVHIGKLSAHVDALQQQLQEALHEIADYKSQQQVQRNADLAKIEQDRRKDRLHLYLVALVPIAADLLIHFFNLA